MEAKELIGVERQARLHAVIEMLIRRSALVSLAVFVILFISLSRHGMPSRAESFFTMPEDDDPQSETVRNRTGLLFALAELKDGLFKHTLELESSDAAELLASQKIGLLLASNWKSGKVVSASIVFTDKTTGRITAKYSTKKGSLIRENRKLEFVRNGPPSDELPSPLQKVSIKISSRAGPDLAIVGQFSEGEPISRFLWMPTTSAQGKSGVASAWGWRDMKEKGPPFSKAQLLAYAWGFGTGGDRIIYSLLTVSTAMWLLGVLALKRASPAGEAMRSGAFTAIGACFLFLSTGIVFCVIVPPFQTPDEPDHFLTYSQMVNRPELASDALLLAKAGHFERIKFKTDEKFSSVDYGRPEPGNWAAYIAALNPDRSLVGRVVWSFAGHFLERSHSGIALLQLRLINVVFVALCLCFSMLLAACALSPGRTSIFMGAPVLLTPSLAFFAMAVSNYPFMIGGYVIQATALGLMWAQSAESYKSWRLQSITGALAGAGIVLAVCSGDNGTFSLAFWGILIPAYWFLRGLRMDKFFEELKASFYFFSAFVGCMVTVWAFTSALGRTFHVLSPMLTSVMEARLSSTPLRFLGAQSLIFLGFTIPLILASLLLLYAGKFLQRSAWLATARKCTVFVLCLGVLFLLFAQSSRIPDFTTTTALGYALKVIYSFFEGFGPGKSDWLVTQSFWGIFGWLDTPMPVFLNDGLRYVAAIGMIVLLTTSIKKNGYLFGISFLFANIIALMTLIGSIAIGYYFLKYGINGRYLIGPYLLMLTLAYEGYRRLMRLYFNTAMVTVLESSVICLLCALIQGIAGMSILNRYF